MHEVGDVKRKPERYGFSDIKDPDFLYIGYEKAASKRILTPPVIAKEAEKYTVIVLCWR